jgi:hypothetical protein
MNLHPVNSLLSESVRLLSERTGSLGDGKWELDGRKGVWRTVRGHRIFFPDGGGEPVGMPDVMKTGGKRRKKVTGAGSQAKRKRKIKGRIRGTGDRVYMALKGGDGADSKAFREWEEEEDGGRGGETDPKKKKALVSKGVRRALGWGVGALIASAFPAIAAGALMYLVMDAAVSKVGRRLGQVFEEKAGFKERFSSAIEGAISDAVDDLFSGKIDLSKAKKLREK